MKTKTTQTTLGFGDWAKVKYLIFYFEIKFQIYFENKISKLKHWFCGKYIKYFCVYNTEYLICADLGHKVFINNGSPLSPKFI